MLGSWNHHTTHCHQINNVYGLESQKDLLIVEAINIDGSRVGIAARRVTSQVAGKGISETRRAINCSIAHKRGGRLGCPVDKHVAMCLSEQKVSLQVCPSIPSGSFDIGRNCSAIEDYNFIADIVC
jgi:hypothetical protein